MPAYALHQVSKGTFVSAADRIVDMQAPSQTIWRAHCYAMAQHYLRSAASLFRSHSMETAW